MIRVSAAHLRNLLNSPAELPVLFISHGYDNTGGPLTLDIGPEAYTDHHHIVITREQLTDIVGDSPTDDDLNEYLDSVQDDVDQTVENLA